MIGPAQENPAGSSRHNALRWKQVAKIILRLLLVIVLACVAFVGVVVFKYECIVGAKPNKLKTKVQPGEFGRWVNSFVGTGGVPWGCGHNFPGAMVPFGMVRLSPETTSLLLPGDMEASRCTLSPGSANRGISTAPSAGS